MTSHPSWSFTAPPDAGSHQAAAPPHQQQHFTSSFGAFGLPQPRASPSNLSLQLESRGVGAQPAATGWNLAPATTTLAGAGGAEANGLAPPPLWGAAGASQASPSAAGSSTLHVRRGSLLAADAMNWEDDAWPTTPSGSQQQQQGAGADADAHGPAGPPPADDMMSLSPSGPPSALSQQLAAAGAGTMFPRQARSRSGSASNSMLATPSVPSALPTSLFPFPTVPPSPVTIARALQVGQKTPPPFLARRLFKEGAAGDAMQEESMTTAASMSGRSSRSGSSSDTPAGHAYPHAHAPRPRVTRAVTMSTALAADEDEEIEELSAVLSRSASAGPEDAFERVVRRPVSRKPNLLPKTKSHLRVLTELRTESSGDQAEIASEATLFRLSRSGAVTVPGMRSSCPGTTSAFDPRGTHSHAASGGAGLAAGPRSAPGGAGGAPRPPPNRFPEQIEEDDLLSSHRLGASSSSSNDGEMDEVAGEAGSDWGGMSVGGYATEDEEERRSNIVWNGFRSGAAVTVATPTSSARSPGAGGSGMRGTMDSDIPFAAPQTPSASLGTRRGKRKLNDDRFEPYAHHAFKRRAVSPAASLSLSPGFGSSGGNGGGGAHSTTSTSSSSRPTPPPPLGNSSLSTSTLPAQSLPVAIPSPPSEISHHQFFSTLSGGTRSAAHSPSATASSLSSSTGGGLGRGFMSFALSDRHRPISVGEERERRSVASAQGIGKMSLTEDPSARSAHRQEQGRRGEEEEL
ncbi:hypothetical protein JCM3774_005020 [Rhodotorula dairenensis]